MHVLDLFSLATPELSLTDISRHLEMPLPTTHRLVKTLEDAGVLAHVEGSDLYRLGPKLLALSARMLIQYPVREVAAPYLRRLAHELEQTITLTRYEHGEVIYLDCVEGAAPISIVCRPGARVPAHSVASGRVQLAYLDPGELDRLGAHGLVPGGPDSLVDARALRAELATIRERGYAIDDGNFRPGTRAAAAPILDALGQPVGAIAMVAFADDATVEQVHAIGRAILTATREISRTLGYAFPSSNGAAAGPRAAPAAGRRTSRQA